MTSLQTTLDDNTLEKLSAQHLDRYMHRVAMTRKYVDQHFRDNLGIPTAPCLDILLALQITADEPQSAEDIANHICETVPITRRYLNLMVSKGFVEMEAEDIRLTSKGAEDLSYIIGQVYGDYLQPIE